MQKHPEFNIQYEYKTMVFEGKCHLIDEVGCMSYVDFIKINFQAQSPFENKFKRACTQKGYNAVSEALRIQAEINERGLTRAEYALMVGCSRRI